MPDPVLCLHDEGYEISGTEMWEDDHALAVKDTLKMTKVSVNASIYSTSKCCVISLPLNNVSHHVRKKKCFDLFIWMQLDLSTLLKLNNLTSAFFLLLVKISPTLK